MDAAKALLDQKIEDGDLSARDIGWTRIDMVEHPDYLTPDKKPDLHIFGRDAQLRRPIRPADLKLGEDKEANVEALAAIVEQFTGDWVTEIACSDIQKEDRDMWDEVVYFGPGEDLEPSGLAYLFTLLAQTDRFTSAKQQVGFHFNSDPECRKEKQLDVDKNHIVFHNGENSIPTMLTVGDDYIDF